MDENVQVYCIYVVYTICHAVEINCKWQLQKTSFKKMFKPTNKVKLFQQTLTCTYNRTQFCACLQPYISFIQNKSMFRWKIWKWKHNKWLKRIGLNVCGRFVSGWAMKFESKTIHVDVQFFVYISSHLTLLSYYSIHSLTFKMNLGAST